MPGGGGPGGSAEEKLKIMKRAFHPDPCEATEQALPLIPGGGGLMPGGGIPIGAPRPGGIPIGGPMGGRMPGGGPIIPAAEERREGER